MEEKVIKLVKSFLQNDEVKLFVVWSCYILGNRKFLVGQANSPLYFEVTYNNNREEWYIDTYTKLENVCIKENNDDYYLA